VDAVAGDAAYGFEAYLHTVHASLQARRVIDRRCHETDRDKTQWPTRGYDGHGRPICSYGISYKLSNPNFCQDGFFCTEKHQTSRLHRLLP
jgi:hypothetical protein